MFCKKKNLVDVEYNKYKEEYGILLKKIKEFDRIAVFRHIAPDFDALGTQFGLVTWLKKNFKDKDIKALGDNHAVFTPRGLFPETDKVNDEWFNKPFLAIIVDVGDKKRIADPRFSRAAYKIKLDHHPVTDKIFDTMLTDTSKAAASEIVSTFVIKNKNKYVFDAEIATYLYIALVGDSGRFQFSSTSASTFTIASELLGTGLNITKIYEKMYEKNLKDLEVIKFILNDYKVSEHGVAYYTLKQEDLVRLYGSSDKPTENLCDRGKENVNFFSPYKGVNIWCSITQDLTGPCFRISIRSRNYVINGVAQQFKGGGHAQAAGAEIKDLTELDGFIKALDQVVIDQSKK